MTNGIASMSIVASNATTSPRAPFVTDPKSAVFMPTVKSFACLSLAPLGLTPRPMIEGLDSTENDAIAASAVVNVPDRRVVKSISVPIASAAFSPTGCSICLPKSWILPERARTCEQLSARGLLPPFCYHAIGPSVPRPPRT